MKPVYEQVWDLSEINVYNDVLNQVHVEVFRMVKNHTLWPVEQNVLRQLHNQVHQHLQQVVR